MSDAQEALRAELALIVERIEASSGNRPVRSRSSMSARPRRRAATDSAATAAQARIRILWIAAASAFALAAAALTHHPHPDRLTAYRFFNNTSSLRTFGPTISTSSRDS